MKFEIHDTTSCSIIMMRACKCKDSNVIEHLLHIGYKSEIDLIDHAATNKSSKVLEYFIHLIKENDIYKIVSAYQQLYDDDFVKGMNIITLQTFKAAARHGRTENIKLLYECMIHFGIYNLYNDPEGFCPRATIWDNNVECLQYLVSIHWDNAQRVYDMYQRGLDSGVIFANKDTPIDILEKLDFFDKKNRQKDFYGY